MSKIQYSTVTVIGGSGNVGVHVVPALVSAGFKVSVTTRLDSSKTFPDNVQVHRVDYDDHEKLVKLFEGQDVVVDCTEVFAVQGHTKFADAAVQAGVKRFIPSEFGMDNTFPLVVDYVPVMKIKRGVVEKLKGYEQKGMTWTGILVGFFFDWTLDVGFFPFFVKDQKAEIWGDPDKRMEVTNMGQIARAVVAVLQHPEDTQNRYVHVNSFTITQNQLLSVFEEVTKSKWTTSHVDVAERWKTCFTAMKNSTTDMATVDVVRAVLFGHGDIFNDWGGKAQEWNKRLGLPQEDLREVVQGVVDRASK